MKKILVLVYLPILEKEYSIYIPIGKSVGTVKNTILSLISELYEQPLEYDMLLINRLSNKIYDDNTLIINTGIKNGEKLILV